MTDRYIFHAKTEQEAIDLQAIGWKPTDRTRRDRYSDQFALALEYHSDKYPPLPDYLKVPR